MTKPKRRRVAKQKSPVGVALEEASKVANGLYGRLVTAENPVLTALLVDLERADGRPTEYERVASDHGIQTGLAIMEPRGVTGV